VADSEEPGQVTGKNSITRQAWLHSQMLAGSESLSKRVLRMLLEHLSQRKRNVADRKKLRDLSKGVCVKMFADAVLWGAVVKGYVSETKVETRATWVYDYQLTDKGREWLGS
jgi:hypothetical protein